MPKAFLSSFVAQAPLILGGLLVYWFKIPTKFVGWLGGYGAGALISAIAFNLIPDAETMQPLMVALWLMVGAGVFFFLGIHFRRSAMSSTETSTNHNET